MSNTWLKTYSELKEYITGNPKIEIGKNIVVIPGDVRPEFYRLFDMVRVTFLKDKSQTLLDEAVRLSENYAEVSQEVTKSLGLTEIKVSASLNRFLNDPTNGLIKSLFDPLFDLLKGKIDATTFEHTASKIIEKSFSELFKSGYIKWISLSLTDLLAPDKALAVSVEVLDRNIEEYVEPGLRQEPVPEPQETKSLSLEHDREAVFMVPDIIVHSAKLGRYVSIRSGLAEVMWTAKSISSNKEWYDFSELFNQDVQVNHWADLFIYIDDKPEDLALVADNGRFCRPDIIIKCMEQADWYERGGLERVKLNHDLLKPKLGSYVVSRLPVPEEAFKELMPEPAASELPTGGPAPVEPEAEGVSGEMVVDQAATGPALEGVSGLPVSEQAPQESEKQSLDIHILTVGFEKSLLVPIIEALLPGEKVAQEPESQ
ncbi:MAG: hypothetical protein ACXABY_18835 [Candidatus Thorarchaeota archaeon]|jgi:hypothetical protein